MLNSLGAIINESVLIMKSNFDFNKVVFASILFNFIHIKSEFLFVLQGYKLIFIALILISLI